MIAALVVAVMTLTACGIGRPAPSHTSPPTQPREVLFVGDSLLLQAMHAVPSSFAFDGARVVTRDRTVWGMGLLHPIGTFASVRDYVAALLTELPRVDTVVFQFSGVCVCQDTVYGSPAFHAAWRAAAAGLVDDVRARGVGVVWVIPPPSAPLPAHLPDVRARLQADDRAMAAAKGIPLVDWHAAFTGVDDAYAKDLFYAELFEPPAVHQVRHDDLVHFAPDGIRRAARWLVEGCYRAWAGATG